MPEPKEPLETPEEPETPETPIEPPVAEETPPAGSKIADVTPPADDVDDKGVSFQNRVDEARRHIEKEYEEKLEREKEKMRLKQRPLTPQEQEELDYGKTAREIARDEIVKLQNEERTTNMKAIQILNLIENKKPIMKPYRMEIENQLAGMSLDLRSNPMVINRIVNEVIGYHIDEISGVRPKTPELPKGQKKLVSIEPTLPSSPSPDSVAVVLTEEEEKFADEKYLWDKGFTNQEIRDFYNQRQEKKKRK